MFDQHMSVRAVERALKGKLSSFTLRSLREEWARERSVASGPAEQTPAEPPSPQLPLAVAANDTCTVASEPEAVEAAQDGRSEPTERETERMTEPVEEVAELAAEAAAALDAVLILELAPAAEVREVIHLLARLAAMLTKLARLNPA